MKVRYLSISNFRGFQQLELMPPKHVLLVGEPGAGRSDLVEALWRVLSPESSRFPLSEDLDFFNRDLTKRIEIEVVLGELGPRLEQAFLDRLELWDLKASQLVEELGPESDRDSLEYVLRLCYRATWDSDQQQARQWVDFPKFSDPTSEDFKIVPRALREELPVAFLAFSDSPLSLGVRGDLRRLIDAREHTDFSKALDQLMEGVGKIAEGLVQSKDLTEVLERILEPLRVPLGLGDRPAGEIIRFSPEGGSLAGVLRGLQATMRLREELGFLPIARHGSTLSALLQLAQGVAKRNSSDAVVVIDDFGENIDLDAAEHIASTLRLHAAQLWLSSRRGAIGRCFHPEELVRLAIRVDGKRRAFMGKAPLTKAERIASRHLNLQILPAVSSRAVVIVEGPHDRCVLVAAATKLGAEDRIPLPSAQRIAILDAGAADGSGGISAIPRLAKLARTLGFHVTALIDWDSNSTLAVERLSKNLEAADVVLRWPEGHAIERAVLSGLEDGVINDVLRELSNALSVPLGFDPGSVSGAALLDRAIGFLKSSGGLHGAFIDALPEGRTPPLIRKCLEEIQRSGSRTGLVQL